MTKSNLAVLHKIELPDASKKVVCFIHAKGNSERIASKNKAYIGNYPLYGHAIKTALSCRLVNEVIIDSDDIEILLDGHVLGATKLRRPPELATNKTEGNALARWAVSQRPDAYVYVQLMCTSPFLKSETIDHAIEIILDGKFNSVASSYKQVLYVWKNGHPTHLLSDGSVPNSRYVEPVEYETQGLYVSTVESIKRTGCRMDPSSHTTIPVSLVETIDIDTQEELEFARLIWLGNRFKYV